MQGTVAALLAEIVGTSAIDPSGNPGVIAVHPDGEEQISQICRLAQDHKWRLVPRNRPLVQQNSTPTVVLYTDKLVGISEYAPGDMIVSVRSGTPFEALQDSLRTKQQMLALDPVCDSHATVGGLVACAAYGPSRVGYGVLRDMVTGMRVVRADGSVIKVGSKVVKNVAGYDLPKLFIGSHGSLGIITECTFKLRPIPRHRTLFALTGSATEIARIYQEIMRRALSVCALELVGAPQSSPSSNSDDWMLLVGSDEVADAAQALQAQIQAIDGRVSLEIMQNSQVAEFWNRYRQELIPAATVIRVQMAPTRMVAFAASLRQVLSELGISVKWSLTLSEGVGKIYGHDRDPKNVETLVNTVVRQCQSTMASSVIEALPPEFLWTQPMMQSPRVRESELRLMQQIKDAYDPRGIFNPGVYARGM